MKNKDNKPTITILEANLDDLLVIHYSRLTGHADPQTKERFQEESQIVEKEEKWGDLW